MKSILLTVVFFFTFWTPQIVAQIVISDHFDILLARYLTGAGIIPTVSEALVLGVDYKRVSDQKNSFFPIFGIELGYKAVDRRSPISNNIPLIDELRDEDFSNSEFNSSGEFHVGLGLEFVKIKNFSIHFELLGMYQSHNNISYAASITRVVLNENGDVLMKEIVYRTDQTRKSGVGLKYGISMRNTVGKYDVGFRLRLRNDFDGSIQKFSTFGLIFGI